MYVIAIIITVILILIILLSLPTSIKAEIGSSTVITIDLTLFAVVFTKDEKKRKTQRNKKKQMDKAQTLKERLKKFKIIIESSRQLIKRSKVEINKIVLTDTASLSKGTLSTPLFFVLTSVILTFLKTNSRNFTIKSPNYILSKENAVDKALDITISFFLFDLIIFLLTLLYLHLRNKVRRQNGGRIYAR